MNTQNFNITFSVDQTQEQVFDAIKDVNAWWTENLTGSSQNVGDEFSVQFGTVHYSKHKLTEVIPNQKVVWQVTDSNLTFVEQTDEWTGNTIIFDIAQNGGKTQLSFTQIGLTPDVQCYNGCSSGWAYYIGSLQQLITTGKGTPALKVAEAETEA